MSRVRTWQMVVALAMGLAVAAVPVAAAAPARPPAGPAAEADEAEALREQSIYIPYEKLREVFEKEGRGVFLPYEKFQELWKAARAQAAPPPEAKPPVDALVTEVSAVATVSEDVVTVEATVRIEVLKEGWVEVPLRLGDVALTGATLGQEPARIVADAKAGYKLLVEKEGEAPERLDLSLSLAKAYTKAPGQNSVSIQSPRAPVSRWEVRIPEAGVEVNIHPLLAATEVPPAEAGAGQTVVRAFVGAAPTVRIEWTPKAEGAKGLAALASVEVRQQTRLDEGIVRTRADLAYEIRRAALSRLQVEVPADAKVAGVFDPNVREWSVEAGDDVQTVTVELFEPAKKDQNLVLELEKFSAEGADQVQVPVIRALGVGRQQGVVVVRVASGLRAEAVSRTGLLQLDPSELPGPLAKEKWDFSYRYAALPFALTLGVEKVQPRILAESLVEAHLGTESLEVNLVTVFTVERAGVFRFEFDVPKGFEVRSVRGLKVGQAAAAQVDAHHLEGPDETRLAVDLSRKALGRVALEVHLHRSLAEPDLLEPTGRAADIPLPLPRVAPGTVEHETGRLVVYAPESLRVNPGETEGLRTITYQEATQHMRQGRKGDERPVLAFAYTDEPVAFGLSAERRKPHVTVRQLLVARIDSGVVKYTATFHYDVRYSGVKTVRIDVPEALAPDIRVTPLSVRHEQVPDDDAPDDLAEGYVAWRLSGETEFMGDETVTLQWEEKIEKLDVGKSVNLTVPRLLPRDVDRAWGQIVLAKAESIDVRPAEDKQLVTGLRPIDPQHDLMSGASVERAARAFEFHEAWALTVVATMYRLEEIKHTSIERALVRMVIARNEQVSVQALYRARSARQRLRMDMPAGRKLHGEPLRLNGRPVPLEEGGDEGRTVYVPLTGLKPDAPFLLELRYILDEAHGGLDLAMPSFPEEPAVQRVYLSVWLPGGREGWDYVGAAGPWTEEMVWRFYEDELGWRPVARRHSEDLIRWVTEGLSVEGNPGQTFATDGHHHLFSTLQPAPPPEGNLRVYAVGSRTLAVLVFAVVLVAGLVLNFTPWTVRCVAVGALVAALVLLGVFAPAFAHQVADWVLVSAAFLVLVIWVVWYLAVTRPRDPDIRARKEARREAREARLARLRAQARPAGPQAEPPPGTPAEGEASAEQEPPEASADDDAEDAEQAEDDKKEGGPADA
ncbi:MAG: hypothetical protein R6X20_04040 [Phycisphaerae bacterium]